MNETYDLKHVKEIEDSMPEGLYQAALLVQNWMELNDITCYAGLALRSSYEWKQEEVNGLKEELERVRRNIRYRGPQLPTKKIAYGEDE